MKGGEVLAGRYELRGVLGRGGMAEVREGWDLRLSRAVAIKLLYPVFGDAENRLRFEAEARAAATLTSPHIVVVHDSGEHDGTPFIVMERLPGVSLADRIATGPLPQAMVRAVLDDVLAALEVAHGAGILHRDIKPANILFTATGDTKVTDFGIAKTADAAYTVTGQIVGTMAYLSPQRIAGRPATVSDDLYAIGVVGYEALTGRRPFLQQELPALAQAILHGQPPPVAALRPDVDPILAATVERAMARDSSRPFGSARQMRTALIGGEPLPVGPRPATRVLDEPLPAGPRPATRVLDAPLPVAPTFAPVIGMPPPTRTRKLLIAGAILATLALAIILLALDSATSPPPLPQTTSTPVPTTTTPTTTLTLPSTTSPLPLRPGKKRGQDEGD